MKLIDLKIFLLFQLEVSNTEFCKQQLARDKCGIFKGVPWNICFMFSWESGPASLWLSYFLSILFCGMRWLIPKPMSWWPQLRHFPCEIMLAILMSLITMSPPRPSHGSLQHLKKSLNTKGGRLLYKFFEIVMWITLLKMSTKGVLYLCPYFYLPF